MAVVVLSRFLGENPDSIRLATGYKNIEAIVSYMHVGDGRFIFIESELFN
jgi:hypothetical protein